MRLDPRSFLTVVELAREVRIDPKVAYKAIRDGELTARKIPGRPRSLRVQWKDAEAWLGVPPEETNADERIESPAA